MTFVVPFDGSEPSRVGIRRAVELAPASIRVVAFSVVPRKHTEWARDRELLDADEAYSNERVVSRLQDRAHDVDDEGVRLGRAHRGVDPARQHREGAVVE